MLSARVSSSGPYGLFFWQSNYNVFFHNNFLLNGGQVENYNSTNFWDNGFEGNFWTHYNGVDSNLDGIGDTPQFMDSTNRDNFPLMGTFHSFNTSLDYVVDIVSDFTIDEVHEANVTIDLQVSNATANQTVGFCRMSIPHALIDPNDGPISVVIDNGQTPVVVSQQHVIRQRNPQVGLLQYPHSTHEIVLVPEFPMALIGTAHDNNGQSSCRLWKKPQRPVRSRIEGVISLHLMHRVRVLFVFDCNRRAFQKR